MQSGILTLFEEQMAPIDRKYYILSKLDGEIVFVHKGIIQLLSTLMTPYYSTNI